MRPIVLHGHERSITQIKYNKQGDLLFSVAKDTSPTLWYSENGERVGTYNGHTGALWCIDVNRDSSLVLSGGADNTARLWDCETGACIRTYESKSSVRVCAFNEIGTKLVYFTDAKMGHKCELVLYDTNSGEPCFKCDVDGSRTTAAQWGLFDEYLIAGHEDGEIKVFDIRNLSEAVEKNKKHTDSINDMQMNKDRTMFITASRDHSAKLFDSQKLNVVKTYLTARPVNSAAISPLRDHVVLGGGQEAAEVTTTASKAGKFQARFFHLVFEEEIGRVKGHFGPINSVAFHPNGKSYSSGGEDGYVRIHEFDQSYFDFEFEY